MRRLGISVAVVAVALAVVPAAASASFHLQNVNEVMLASATGDSNVRFVELYDAGGAEESFPPVSYALAAYDAAGHKLAQQSVSADGMRAAALANKPYLVSTAQADAAFVVTGDEQLTIALPKTAGQVCYLASGAAYSCITWGCITHFVSTSGTGSFHGAVPANGKSAQRQNNNSVQIASPTPKATNAAGTSPKACPNPPAGFPGVKIAKQTVTVKNNKVPVSVKCPAIAKGSCIGTLTLKTAKKVKKPDGTKKKVTLGSANFTIAKGKTKVVKVSLSNAGKFVMAHHSSVKTNATARAHDGTGKSKTTTGEVTVKAPPK